PSASSSARMLTTMGGDDGVRLRPGFGTVLAMALPRGTLHPPTPPPTDDPVGGVVAVVGAAVVFLAVRALVKFFVVRGLGQRLSRRR
ncbi:MAG: hypothetical protein ACREKH_15805, partial [Candidatus Rokuibacteriota bacterium]